MDPSMGTGRGTDDQMGSQDLQPFSGDPSLVRALCSGSGIPCVTLPEPVGFQGSHLPRSSPLPAGVLPMITRKFSFVALLLVLPVVVAEAQRGGGGSTRKTRGFGAADGSETDAILQGLAESPSLSRDLQKANPVESLLGKKKDLQLSADEEKELK